VICYYRQAGVIDRRVGLVITVLTRYQGGL